MRCSHIAHDIDCRPDHRWLRDRFVFQHGPRVYLRSFSRGWTVSLFQLAITLGILLAYIVDYAFASVQGWRWMFGLAVVPAAIFALGMFFLPESPRWLAKRGRLDAARAILSRIRDTSDVDAELQEIQRSLDQAQEHGNWRDLLSARLRPALIVGIGLAVFQQVTGINTVIYYAPMIVQSAGISSASGAILTTAGIGIVNVLMTIVSMWLIDRIGRRPLRTEGYVFGRTGKSHAR